MQVVEDICKHVAVLVHGKVVESGTVQDVFSDPQHTVTKQLLGKAGWDE